MSKIICKLFSTILLFEPLLVSLFDGVDEKIPRIPARSLATGRCKSGKFAIYVFRNGKLDFLRGFARVVLSRIVLSPFEIGLVFVPDCGEPVIDQPVIGRILSCEILGLNRIPRLNIHIVKKGVVGCQKSYIIFVFHNR